MRQFHKSQKMDVIFVGLKNNIFYKSLIISIICFTYSLNSYSQAAYKSPLLATDTWQVFYTLNTIEWKWINIDVEGRFYVSIPLITFALNKDNHLWLK